MAAVTKRDRSKDSDDYAARWWQFAKTRPTLRRAVAGLERFFITPETSKYRIMASSTADLIPDHQMYVVAHDDPFVLGVLSSRMQGLWSLRAGSYMGVGNDPRWRNKKCFDPFPFPDPEPTLRARIGRIAEQLDTHRKGVHSRVPRAHLTAQYNALERLRALGTGKGEPLSEQEREFHDAALIGILRTLHDDLDAAVAEAYGWPSDLTDEQILERLVALNAERTKEEKEGRVRWLRPEFQAPGEARRAAQAEIGTATVQPIDKGPAKKAPWPKALPEQIRALMDELEASSEPLSPSQLARRFKGAPTPRVATLLETLTTLGQARELTDQRFAA